MTDNDDWQRFYKEHVEPLTALTSAKLGADRNEYDESENNIFDADFMDTLRGERGGDDLERADEGSGEDGKKFIDSIKQCFSSTLDKNRLTNLLGNAKHPEGDGLGLVDDVERDVKTHLYAQQDATELTEELRNSLTDQGIGEAFPLHGRKGGRDRASSNDNFLHDELPPLPADEDNRDLDKEGEGESGDYASNQATIPHNLSAIDSVEDNFKQFPVDGFKLEDDDVADLVGSPPEELDARAVSQGQGERFDDLDPFGSDAAADLGSDKRVLTTDSFDKFLEEGNLDTEFVQAPKEELLKPIVAEAEVEQPAKKEELGDIFDSLNEFDRFYGIEDEVTAQPEPNLEQGLTQSQEIVFNPLLTVGKDGEDFNDRKVEDEPDEEAEECKEGYTVAHFDKLRNSAMASQPESLFRQVDFSVERDVALLSKSAIILSKPLEEEEAAYDDNQYWSKPNNLF